MALELEALGVGLAEGGLGTGGGVACLARVGDRIGRRLGGGARGLLGEAQVDRELVDAPARLAQGGGALAGRGLGAGAVGGLRLEPALGALELRGQRAELLAQLLDARLRRLGLLAPGGRRAEGVAPVAFHGVEPLL